MIRQFLLIIGSFFLVSVQASELSPSYFVPSLLRADSFANDELSRLKQNFGTDLSTIQVEIVHMGEEIPPELGWVIDHFKREGLKLSISLLKERQITALLKEWENHETRPSHKKVQLQYFADNGHGEKLSIDERSLAYKLFRNILVQVRHFFGIPKGVSWIMYRDYMTRRSAKEHLVEAGSAAIQALMIYAIDFAILQSQALEGAPIHPVAGAATSAGFKLVTGYIERANNEFFVQGNSFSQNNLFDLNRPFFFLTAYLHSILIGLVVQAAVHGGEVSETIVLHTAWNSVLGLFAKALPLYLISKHQTKKSVVDSTESLHHLPWITIALNAILGFSYQALKAIHLFQFEFLRLDLVFVMLGFGGIGYEVTKHLVKNRKPGENFSEAALARLADDLNSLSYRLKRKRMRKADCAGTLTELTKISFYR